LDSCDSEKHPEGWEEVRGSRESNPKCVYELLVGPKAEVQTGIFDPSHDGRGFPPPKSPI
jgi:hypothetical protein